MGFSRQEYWSGVPLPSPNTKLGLPIIQPLRYEVGLSPRFCPAVLILYAGNAEKLSNIIPRSSEVALSLQAGLETKGHRATFLPSLLQEVDAKLFWFQKEPHPFGVKELQRVYTTA